MFTKIAESKWLKIVLFITTFAFVGTGFVALVVYKLSGQISGVAEVNGSSISQQEFFYEVNQIEARYQSQGIDVSSLRKMIYAQALENLINRELLYQFAKKEGIEATKEEVKKLILDIPAFQKDGKFDKQIFLGFLQSMNLSPQTFEEIMIKQLSAGHVLDLLRAGLYITDDEIDLFLKKRLSSINGKAIIIEPEISISEEEIKNYYEKNKDKFALKKGKKIKVYEIDVSNLGTEKANSIAQSIYKDLKENKIPQTGEGVKVIYDDVLLEENKKTLPDAVIEELKNFSKEKRIIFVKGKDKYYIVYYEKDQSIPMSLQQAKSQIESLLKEEKIKKELEDIKSQIEKEKSLNLTVLQEKYKGKIKEIKNEKYMQLQVDYGLSPEDVDKVVKTGKGFSQPFITDNKLVIFYVSEIIPPDEKEYEKAKNQFKPLFENQKFSDIVSMLIDKLKNDAGLKINKRVFE